VGGTLSEGTAYLAVKSEKVGPDRWFLLKIKSGVEGWVEGINLSLADVRQPSAAAPPPEVTGQREKPSAFAAEWVVASVKGVGVYERPSIAAKIRVRISPPKIYKVMESSADDSKEWYRIQLDGKKEGWVQALDVSLTKPK
jgi:hypothetical protein